MLAAIFGDNGLPERPPSRLRKATPKPDRDHHERAPHSRSPSRRSRRSSEASISSSTTSADADLEHLNSCLEVLADIFPDVQVEVFREMLSTSSSESRLYVVTEALMKNPTKWVRGRTRLRTGAGAGAGVNENGTMIPNKNLENALSRTEEVEELAVNPDERFRAYAYKQAVRQQLSKEFKGLSSATINAVLAEHNYNYSSARPTLFRIASKSWRYSFSSLFRRKTTKSLEIENHPLVIYPSKPAEDGLLTVPKIRPTECHELNQELHDTLIVPLEKERRVQQISRDKEMAEILNQAEAEENNELYDCECCYVDSAMERITSCSSHAHLICHSCVQHAVRESLFGQGWARNVVVEKGSIRCLSASTGGSLGEECDGSIPTDQLRHAIEDQDGGDLVWNKFEARLVGHNLSKIEETQGGLTGGASVKLVRCPFCSYAEVDETEIERAQELSSPWHILQVILLKILLGPILLLILILLFLSSLINSEPDPLSSFTNSLSSSRTRLLLRRRPQRFRCQNPKCKKASCVSCSKLWKDPHECHDSLLTSYRTTIDLALSNALKRTCPRCNTSFIKSSGCNKLTCPCGYKMCYLCRADISSEGYKHFCSHFREYGGSCRECDKCDLYRAEDEELVLRKAKEKAEEEWRSLKQDELKNVGIAEVKRRNDDRTVKMMKSTKKSGAMTMIGGGNAAERGLVEVRLEDWLDWILDVTE